MIDECDRCRKELPHYIYADLPPLQSDAIAVHLSTCSSCAAEEEQFRRWKDRVRDLSRPELPASFWQEYRGELKNRLPKGRKRVAINIGWLPRPAFLVALALLVAGAAIWLPLRTRSPQGLPPAVEHPAVVETLELVENLGMFENLS
jgi:anti-sigma factor RsiW